MSERRPPRDLTTRERIRTELDRNMCVEAGAGTGKTTIMVDRVVEIIRTDRAQIDELVIITFTEKAAAELAARVREALERALATASDELEISLFQRALKNIYRARIETIHAFASSLLRERPVEARLDPNFEVLDTLRADLSFDERFREWLNTYLGSDEEDPAATAEFRRALNRGLGVERLRELCDIVHRRRYILPLSHSQPEDPDVFTFRDRFINDARELREIMPTATAGDRGLEQIEIVLGQADRLQRAGADRHRLERVILAAGKTNAGSGANSNWDPPQNNQRQKEIRKGLNDDLQAIQAELRSAALAGVLPLAERFAREYAELRRRAGQAEFEDLLIWARDLLRDEPHVRRDFQNRFRCILVDEFQDTDPLQVEIVMYLSSEGQQEGDWTRLVPTPGKLFVVGDPKQSIYRFRRADISIYQQVKEEILAGEIEFIQQNFRSSPEVIDWVNHVFSSLIAPQERRQPEYIPLDAYLPSTGPPHAPVVMVSSTDPVTAADDVRREEARLLAKTIRLAVEGGTWRVRSGECGGTRPAEYRDIAILIPKRTKIELYEDVLAEAGIPFRHEGGREYFQRQEVRDLRACLRAIDNPGDNLSIVAALRSSAFGYSDRDIFTHRSKFRTFDYRASGGHEHSPLADGLTTLNLLHELRRNLTLPEVVEQTIERTGLVEFALTLPHGGDQSAANLLKMVDQARQFSAAGGGGLRAFVRWTATSSEVRSDESDAPVAESTDDVVRLMTIHAAKGLEFPIVALANLNGRGGNQGPVVVPNYRERRLAVQIGGSTGFQTPGFADAKEIEDLHEAAEDLRLLYVAATRAADFLILPMAVQRDKAQGLATHLLPFLPELDKNTQGHDVQGVHVVDPATLPAIELVQSVRANPTPAEVDEARLQRDGWQVRRDSVLQTGNRELRIVTASSQKSWQQDYGAGSGAELMAAGDTVVAGERGLPLRIGNALHGAMERIDLRNVEHVNVRGLTEQAIDEAELPPGNIAARNRVHEMVQRALDSELVERARRSEQLVQEVEFGHGLADDDGHDPGLVRGQMDLVFMEGDEIIVGDFKSDRVDAVSAEARTRDGYLAQAAVYAWAAHQIIGRPVREVIFFFAEPGVQVRLDVEAEGLLERGARIVRQGNTEIGTEPALLPG